VDAVKIDAEGSELRVLSGMLETIFRCEPIFLIENNDFHHVTQFLCRLGYRCYRWENAIDKLVPMYGTSANSFYLLDNHCEQFESLLVGPEHLALSEQMATAMDECDEAADFKNH
jgi:hypothetical protein